LYINDKSQIPGMILALFADDTWLYAADRKEGHVLSTLLVEIDRPILFLRWMVRITNL
jgi:hypothetical protein